MTDLQLLVGVLCIVMFGVCVFAVFYSDDQLERLLWAGGAIVVIFVTFVGFAVWKMVDPPVPQSVMTEGFVEPDRAKPPDATMDCWRPSGAGGLVCYPNVRSVGAGDAPPLEVETP